MLGLYVSTKQSELNSGLFLERSNSSSFSNCKPTSLAGNFNVPNDFKLL
ncbi:hypothetical protein J6O48_07700 [bacterium]|nr:hypothetical protein [bacterium]